MSNTLPIVDRIRIIPRPEDFLDRNVGSSGEVFFSKETNSLRVYSGKDRGGFEIARADLNNISNDIFSAKATAAGITGATPDWSDITNKPTFATVATSGSYNDLSNTPAIPSLTGYATEQYVDNAISNINTSNGSAVENFQLIVTGDDSTQRVIQSGEVFQIEGGTGITTSSDAEGKITITASATGTFTNLTEATTASLTIDKIYEPAIAMYRVDNVGTSAYTMSSHYSGNNPTIYVLAGTTIAFDLDDIPSLPFEIQDPLGDPYNTGLVHVAPDGTVSIGTNAQGKSNGTLYWRVPESISGGYRYQCQTQPSMVGAITIKRLSVI